MKHLMTIILGLILLTSCQKDVVLTAGEKVGQEIQSAVGSSTRVQVLAIRFSDGQTMDTDDTFRLSGQFVQVGTSKYNLSQLTKYTYNNQNFILRLYFI